MTKVRNALEWLIAPPQPDDNTITRLGRGAVQGVTVSIVPLAAVEVADAAGIVEVPTGYGAAAAGAITLGLIINQFQGQKSTSEPVR